jgi:hypothetical protein
VTSLAHVAHETRTSLLNAASRPVQVIPCTTPRLPPLATSLAASTAALEQLGYRGDRGEFDRALRRQPVAVTFVEVG